MFRTKEIRELVAAVKSIALLPQETDMKELDNLTRDVLAAEAAGYGPWYGRYIATHGHTPRYMPVRIQGKTTICRLCGAEFILPDNHPRKYCSAECRCRARENSEKRFKEKKKARMAEASACAASPG